MNRHFSSSRFVIIALVTLWFTSVASAEDVPFKGEASGQDQRVTLEPNGIRIISSCVGTGTQVGRFTEAIDYVLSYDLVNFAGVATFTAANGDEVSFKFQGTIPGYANQGFPTPFTATFVIIGGTGRFADATGSGTLDGVDYGQGNFAFTFDGLIDF
jgi:hypothetical protein